MKQKTIIHRLLSFLLVLAMLIGMAPTIIPQKAEAASNMENGFEGQDADVFSALGFDTTELPEGYDAETTDNPYGRDTILGNQVWEALVASSGGVNIYGKNNNSVSGSDISGVPNTGTGVGMEMFAVAAADFDGDGLQGEVVYVGFDSIKYNTYVEKANLQLRIYDAKTGSISDLKTVGTGINPAQVIRSGGTAYSRLDYAWQNLLQVTAGDYDCDGRYEIAVYVPEDGNGRVDIYKYQETSQSGEKDWMQLSNWDRVWSYVVNNTGNEIFNMVSLVSADINQDGVDDLGISYGRMAPYGNPFSSVDVDKSKAVILWGAKSNMLQKHSAVNLNEGELGDLTRVSLTVGDLDGDGAKELIATGQPVSDVEKYYSGTRTDSNTTRAIITYLYDYEKGLVINSSGLYKPVDGKMVTSENSETGTTEGWQSNNGFDNNYASVPLMRTNAAVFKPQGYDYPFLYLDSCLYECMEGQFTLKMSLDDANYDGQNTLGGDAFWGMHELQLYMQISDAVSYYLRGNANYMEYGVVAADINGDGYDTLLTNFYRCDSGAQTTDDHQHAAAYMSLYSTGGALAVQRSGNEVTTSFVTTPSDYTTSLNTVALAMVDADMDTVILEYTGVHYLTYSDPKVLAIIAAAPYFEDVDVICDYDYAWQNATSYSRIQGEGHTDHVAVDFEVGAFASMETEVGGGKISVETSVNYTLEWQQETTKSTEYTLTFETSQDEDAVAFYCIPTENYVYRIKTPDGKGGYVTTLDTITNTFTPCYQVLTLEYYESLQGNYDELPQISGKAITSTPGDPSSYPSSTSGYDVIAQWNDDPAGVSFGNGAITQEITITTEQAETYNMGAAWDFQFGGGIGSQSDLIQYEMDILGGVQWSLNPTGGWTDIKLEGTSISGTVTNMPLEFQDYGYYYTWKLFSYNYKFDDGTSIPVISYVVGDVSEPPRLPEDFQQDYDRTTSDKNVLTWTYDANFDYFKIYKYYDFPVGGGLQLVETIPSITPNYTLKYDEAGKPYKEYYFEDLNLAPYAEYQYAIQVGRKTPVPPESARSGLLTARTKAANGNPVMVMAESDGENDGLLQVYPDKNSDLTVYVTGPEGENAPSYYTTVQYQWQKKVNGAWTDITNETDMTLTFVSAGVDTAGEYRCRVNVLTKEDATAITAYTGSVSLTHAKRTSYIDELYVKDVSGGVELYAKVANAHADSASIPGGTVTFNLTNNLTGQHFQYFVELNAAGVATEIREATLPEGMYTVTAYYSGSFIFKASSAEVLYLSQRTSGYDVDAPSEVVYGEGGKVVYREVSKSNGMTVTTEAQPDSYSLLKGDLLSVKRLNGAAAISVGAGATAGKNYYINVEGTRYYFTASHSGTVAVEDLYVTYGTADSYLQFLNDGGKYQLAENTPAGNYVVKMVTNGKATYAPVKVLKRPITLQLPAQKEGEGVAHAPYVTVGSMEMISGSWAPCDMVDGKLNSSLSNTIVSLYYYNTAGTRYTGTEAIKQCGYYVVKDWGGSTNAGKYPNYDIKLLDGSLTVIGATRDVSIGARPFEGQSVGTVYAISPEYALTRQDISDANGLVQSHATGTRMVFTAVPDEGYEIYDWYINGVAQGTKASSFAYVLLAEDTTVEVQFAIKKNSLIFGAIGDLGGGTITCSDPELTSDSVVLANALFTFTAVANEGYHFKEWRYTELGSGTAYDDDDNGKMESTFDLRMPANSCSVYAVFERDYYTFSYEDRLNGVGLTAWYMGNASGDSTVAPEKIIINSGDKIKGDTTITVEAAPGYDLDEEYTFISKGTQGAADYEAGTYILKLTEDTSVTAVANRQTYDVTLEFSVQQDVTFPEGTKLVYTIADQEDSINYTAETPSVTLEDIPGGSDISVRVEYPGYYNLIGWVTGSSKITATAEANKAAQEVKYGDTVEAGTAYWYSVTLGSTTAARYFVAPQDGIVRWEGEQVTVYAAGMSSQIIGLDQDEKLTVRLEEKPQHYVEIADITGYGTYTIQIPEGGAESVGAGNVKRVMVHEGENLTVMVTPAQKWTVSYWEAKAASMSQSIKVRATSLKYAIRDIRENYTFKPIFSSTTYNTISWTSISQDQNNITLSPESGYLSSVSAGSDFKFTLSGAGVGLIDQVFANGVPFVDASSSNAGQLTVSGGVYTISDIQENQVITVTLKPIGITVNGEDIVNMHGTGWTYDHDNQTLTITRSGLTVSGEVTLSAVNKLSIQLSDTAASLTLENLNLKSNAVNVISASAETTSLVLSGKNSITSAASGGYGLYSGQAMIIRGNGSLTMEKSGGGYAIGATTLTFTGNSTVDIHAKSSGGVSAGYMYMGLEGGTTSPTLRIQQTGSASGYPINTFLLSTYTGELSARGIKDAIYCFGMVTYGGIVELSTESVDGYVFRGFGWNIYYPKGYMKRFTMRRDSEVESTTVLKSDYQQGSYDVISGSMNYVRVSPLSSDTTGNVILTVTYNGKEYSAPISGESYKYYYIDLDDLNDTTLKTEILGPDYKGTDEVEDARWLVVAYNQQSPSVTYLGTRDVTFYYQIKDPMGQPFDGYVASTNASDVSLDYRLSGGDTNMIGNRLLVESGVSRLTMDNLTASQLDAGDTDIYLKGDNYLIALEATPLSSNSLNLYSDGTGTLTVNSRTVTDMETGMDPCSALSATSINLHDVKSLTLFSGASAISSASSVDINFYDGNTELTYGQGWNIDEGTNGTTASTRTSATSAGGSYVKIYADTTDGTVTPKNVTVDKSETTDLVKTFELVYMAVDGDIVPLMTTVSDDVTYTTVLLIDSQGKETKLKLAKGDTIPEGCNGSYTESGTGATLKLDLATIGLSGLEKGSYTLRFQQQTEIGTVYATDATLKLIDNNINYGDLSVTPTDVTLSRGQDVTFTTSFTGTTPSSYSWIVDGTAVQTGSDKSFTYTVPESAKAGDVIEITVYSYNGNVELGMAVTKITVCRSASDIAISTADRMPNEDGTYTLHSVTPTGEIGTWDFDAVVTMDSGEANPNDLKWSLWGNNYRATYVDPVTGVVTLSPKETGTDGIMKLTATYTNEDGTTCSETVVLNVSIDAYVGLEVVGTVNGEAVKDIHGGIYANTDEEGYIPGGETVVITAEPDENHKVTRWYVNGVAASEENGYTVDRKNNTLAFPVTELTHYIVGVEYTHHHAEQKYDEQNHWMECSCGDRVEVEAHYDENKDHNCDDCGYVMSECYDDIKNHICDYCGETISECVDEGKNHYCDWCDAKLSDHTDEDTDHICDYCTEQFTECEDVNKNHFCDYCGEKITVCTDTDPADHFCDVCGRELGTCADAEDDTDHNCDVCGKQLNDCADTDDDHLCDTCGEKLSECADKDKDHKCDLCGETCSDCTDENKDHKCDLCGEICSECTDADQDHKCDICGKDMGECVDENNDHLCDLGGEKLTDCADNDNNHLCDICNKPISTCADADGDHNCDTCGKELSTCADENKDHLCDTCGKRLTPCADADGDNLCDICGKEMGVHDCADADSDHLCDTCGKKLTDCADDDKDHVCDLCGVTVSDCSDSEGDQDHLCDVCGKTLSDCTDTDDHLCDTCGEKVSDCADENKDHKCDLCGEKLTDCSDTDDHLCDTCGAKLSDCADENKDHACDLCGTVTSSCVDENNDHKCDICSGTFSSCVDEDKDHVCDICGETLSTCGDENDDHLCDVCGEELSSCADEDKDHICDLCGKTISECLDEDKDHKCDLCGKILTQCVDEDEDLLCDICGEDMHECADGDNDHACDHCGYVLTQCVDGDDDHLCDICAGTNSVCVDDNSDHLCDICGEELTDCIDEDKDHKCDICGETISECVDADHNDVCDICGAATYLHTDANSDHRCDVCALPLSECTDGDKDHLCDICGIVWSVCVDKNTDHVCDICGGTMGTHAPAEDSHICDYCGKIASECADTDSDHLCDVCGETLSTCVDEDNDHLCDICGETVSECVDKNKDHLCDICGKKLTDCIDENDDELCDICTEDITYANLVQAAPGGTVTVDKETAVKGEVVTITAVAKPGRALADFTIQTEEGYEVTITDNGDGTYSFVQPGCDVTISGVFRDGLFNISFASMTMANSLDMNFAFKKESRDDWSGYYAKIVKEYENAEDAVQYVFFEDWKSTTIGGEPYYYVTFTGIAAKEMTDKLYVTIYNADGEAASYVWEDSVQAQAMRNLAKPDVTELAQTMVVDMLNYGTAAQIRFEYNMDDLASGLLTDEQKGFATGPITYVDTSVHGDNYRANVYLVSNIQFMMAFTGIDQSMNAVVTYTDHYGREQQITIPGSEFEKNGGYYVLTIEKTVIADAYQNITCRIYDAEGNLVTEAMDSMASYSARAKLNTGNDLYEMIMKFATSAYAYLHNK